MYIACVCVCLTLHVVTYTNTTGYCTLVVEVPKKLNKFKNNTTGQF